MHLTRNRIIVLLLLIATVTMYAQQAPLMRVTSAGAQLVAGTNTLSTVAETLRATLVVWECTIQNDPDNTIDIFIGDSSSQPIQVLPGESMTIPIQDAATIFVVAASGTPTINFLCR